jgi:hypothetical protein
MSIGYFIEQAAHLTDKERIDMQALINTPNVDIQVIADLIAQGYNVNELSYWRTTKLQICCNMGAPEPEFTTDDYIEIVTQGTEEDKRKILAQLLSRKISIPKDGTMNIENDLVKLLIQRRELNEAKKRFVNKQNSLIKEVDSMINELVRDASSGQASLSFDKNEGVELPNIGNINK